MDANIFRSAMDLYADANAREPLRELEGFLSKDFNPPDALSSLTSVGVFEVFIQPYLGAISDFFKADGVIDGVTFKIEKSFNREIKVYGVYEPATKIFFQTLSGYLGLTDEMFNKAECFWMIEDRFRKCAESLVNDFVQIHTELLDMARPSRDGLVVAKDFPLGSLDTVAFILNTACDDIIREVLPRDTPKFIALSPNKELAVLQNSFLLKHDIKFVTGNVPTRKILDDTAGEASNSVPDTNGYDFLVCLCGAGTTVIESLPKLMFDLDETGRIKAKSIEVFMKFGSVVSNPARIRRLFISK